MALDDLYAEGINASIRNRATLTPSIPEPEPGFSFWGAARTSANVMIPGMAYRGATSGLLESGAFWSELAGAMGDVEASYNYSGMLPAGVARDVEWRPEDAEEAQRRLRTGEAYSNPAADRLRDGARWLGPDPETSGYASQIIYDATRVITKGVGYTMAAGPLAGPMLTGADEAMRASDELRRLGVDLSARTQVGALTGAATAVGVALPVAGKGVASTVGLIAAGGPATFIGQTALTRNILDNAGYESLAMQYDPFDPVGLTVATLLPTAFGLRGLRGRAARPEAAPTADEPQAQPLRPVDRDAVDAAQVQRVKEMVDAWNLADPADVRAANDALLSVMRASSQLADGRPISVADTFPLKDAYAARAVETMIGRAEATRADLLPQADMVAKPGAIAAMRAEIDGLRTRAPDPSDTALVRSLAEQIKRNEPKISQRTAMARARKDLQTQLDDAQARIDALEQQIDDNAEAVEARRAIKLLDEQIEQMKADRAAINAPATGLTPIVAAAREAVRPLRIAERGRSQTPDTQEAAPSGRIEHPALAEVQQRLRDGVEDARLGVGRDLLERARRVLDFVGRVATGQATPRESVRFPWATQALRARAMDEAGLDIGNAEARIRTDSIAHVRRSHPNLTDDDWRLLPAVLETPDSIHRGMAGHGDRERIVLVRSDESAGYVYVAELSIGSKSGDRAQMVTYFKGRPQAVENWLGQATRPAKENAPTTPGGGGADSTSKAPYAPDGDSPTLQQAHDQNLPQSPSSLVTPAASRADIDPVAPPRPISADEAQAIAAARIGDRVAEIQQTTPDALVRMEGDAEPIPLSDVLARLQDDVARADADADLLMVAARCAIGAI